MNPKVAMFIQSGAKYGVFPWIISQTGTWDNEQYKVDAVIWQNSDHLVFRSDCPELLQKLGKDLAACYDPHMPKEIKLVPRIQQYGWEAVDTESLTKRNKGESVTTGRRDRAVYFRWWDKIVSYFHLSEQEALLKSAISRLKTGMCISKIEAEIDTWRIPLVDVDDETEELNEESLRWLRDDKGSQTLEDDTFSPMSRPSIISGNSSSTSRRHERQFNEISGHWSNVQISTLSGWLWPENDGSNSTEK